jgi:hypothetical protein
LEAQEDLLLHQRRLFLLLLLQQDSRWRLQPLHLRLLLELRSHLVHLLLYLHP